MARTQVQSELIATNAISGTIIADNAITATHIATNSISGVLVQDSGIVTTMIAANNVTAAKIVTNAIQTRHIADDQVTGDKLTNNITLAGTLTFGDGHTLGNDGDDNLVLTGSASENIIIDSADDIILDADGGDITFKDGGTTIAKFSNSSSDFVITSDVDDKDIIFKGQDSTSEITALTLDMSEAGKAKFNSSVQAQIAGFYLTENTTNAFSIASNGANGFLKIRDEYNSADRITILNSGNVGIGTDAPDALIEIVSSDPRIRLRDDTAGGAADGGGILEFVGYHAGSGDGKREWARITGLKENATGGNVDGYLKFYTNSGSLTERMRITSDGNVGINCSNPQTKFVVQTTDGGSGIEYSLGASLNYLQSYDRNASDYIPLKLDGEDLRFGTNDGTERMRIDSSGNVGIGTASPADPQGFGKALHIEGGTNSVLYLRDTGNSNYGYLGFAGGSDNRTTLTSFGSGYLQFATNNTEAMRIDSDGNVHLGYAGDTWHGDYTALTGPNYSLSTDTAAGAGKYVTLAYNAYVDTGNAWTYMNADEASCIQQGNGDIFFYTAGAGSANADITFTPKMTILNNGNVGIGNNNPQHPFIVDLQSGEVAMFGSNGMNNSGAYAGIGLGQVLANNTTYQKIKLVSEGRDNGHYKSNFHILVDITADGNSAVLADSKLKIDGDSGKVTVGATTVTDNYVLQIKTSNGYGQMGSHNGTYFHHETDRLYWYWNEACQAVGGFSTYSDERLKKDITTVTGALDSVAKMKGVTFKWIDPANGGKGEGDKKQFGVTAQNMLEIDADLPSLRKDVFDESKEYYNMDYSRLSPYFIEAIKELKTKLEAAEARIKTLEDA